MFCGPESRECPYTLGKNMYSGVAGWRYISSVLENVQPLFTHGEGFVWPWCCTHIIKLLRVTERHTRRDECFYNWCIQVNSVGFINFSFLVVILCYIYAICWQWRELGDGCKGNVYISCNVYDGCKIISKQSLKNKYTILTHYFICFNGIHCRNEMYKIPYILKMIRSLWPMRIL